MVAAACGAPDRTGRVGRRRRARSGGVTSTTTTTTRRPPPGRTRRRHSSSTTAAAAHWLTLSTIREPARAQPRLPPRARRAALPPTALSLLPSRTAALLRVTLPLSLTRRHSNLPSPSPPLPLP